MLRTLRAARAGNLERSRVIPCAILRNLVDNGCIKRAAVSTSPPLWSFRFKGWRYHGAPTDLTPFVSGSSARARRCNTPMPPDSVRHYHHRYTARRPNGLPNLKRSGLGGQAFPGYTERSRMTSQTQWPVSPGIRTECFAYGPCTKLNCRSTRL